MKNNILFLLLGLLVWIFGGLYLHHKFCCSGGNTATTVVTTSPSDNLEIKDGSYFAALAQDNIKFGDQKATYTMSKEVESVLAKTVGYLNQHPAKILQITVPNSNLGKQRGEAIAAFLTANDKTAKYQVAVAQTDDKQLNYNFSTLKPFSATSGSTNFNCLDNFIFERSNFEFAVPLSDELNDLLKKTATHLKENPTTKLEIIGDYLSSEENNSSATNLGKARANKIRSILLEKYNVSPSQIDYKGLQKDNLTFMPHQQFEKDLLIGPIDFVFTTQENNKTAGVDAAKLKSLEKDLLVNPRRLYFETGKNKIIIDAKFREYFENVIYYLENVPTAKLECSGHTDSRGDDNNNFKLAQERANFTANYFSKQGIASNKINAVSLGEKQPIETNETASGRAKNRRVEIIVKKQ